MKKVLIFALGIFLFWACTNSGTENSEVSNHHHTDESHVGHQDHEHIGGESLELNNGEKWLVNEEMKPHMAKQEEIIKEYIQSGDTDHLALASRLQENNQSLIKSCTMTGKGHDELHKWLHPYMALLVDLGQAETADEAGQLISDIQTSFETYHNYFQ